MGEGIRGEVRKEQYILRMLAQANEIVEKQESTNFKVQASTQCNTCGQNKPNCVPTGNGIEMICEDCKSK